MLGSCWLKVASSWLQGGLRSVYVGSSWPQDAQQGVQEPPRPSKITQNGAPNASQDAIFDVLVAVWLIFINTKKKTKKKHGFLRFYNLGKCQFLTLSWLQLYKNLPVLSYVLQNASRSPQDLSKLAFLRGPNFKPPEEEGVA